MFGLGCKRMFDPTLPTDGFEAAKVGQAPITHWANSTVTPPEDN